jgi:biopolymer transport protein ExbB
VQLLFDAWVDIRDFLEQGGPVLLVIASTIFVMWVLIIERIVHFHTMHRRWIARAEAA